jgi:glycosyltransferase involved in cell wall biosynthesis
VKVELITLSERADAEMSAYGEAHRTEIVLKEPNRYHPLSWRRRFCTTLSRGLKGSEPIVLYDVGLWLPSNHFAARAARQARVPFVVSPRGMLSPRAVKVSKWKKRLAWALYQKYDLKSANLLHATSEAEAADLRSHHLQQPIAVIPNGVELPPDFSSQSSTRDHSRALLFLSRLHPIKGLSDLVHAWARVRPKGWRVVVAGPNEGNHRAEMQRCIDSLGLHMDFKFVGAVEGDAKWKLYHEADLFVLPSYSESFGQAIAEALVCGVPVITSWATPWQVIEEKACGWWIETGIDSLAHQLSITCALPNQELKAMGNRGRQFVVEAFSWSRIANQFIHLFESLLSSKT